MWFGLVPVELGAPIVVFSLIAAVLSSVMLVLQRGHKHGALAELIPGVERLQEKLRVVDKNLGELKETTEALRKGQGRKALALGERLKHLERSGIDAAGGGAAATRAVADIRDLLRPGNPEIDGIPAEKLPSLVKRILEDLQKPAARAEDYSDKLAYRSCLS